jgi:hypothetical protein
MPRGPYDGWHTGQRLLGRFPGLRRIAGGLTRGKDATRVAGSFQGAMAVLALSASFLSLMISVLVNRQSSSSESIDDQYQMFVDLVELGIREPSINHLLSMSDNYASVECDVSHQLGQMSPGPAATYRLKERAVANYIFTIFERSLYQKSRTHAWPNRLLYSDADRFNAEVIAYFTGRVLRNPRLLWYWSPEGGRLSTYYERSTIDYYNSHVLSDPTQPLLERPDADGPSCPPD